MEIGAGSTVCEGALVEKHSKLGPGSVVPPGTRIPSGQLWQGNPVQYVRDLTEDEIAGIKTTCEEVNGTADKHAREFLPFGTLYKEAEKLIEKQ